MAISSERDALIARLYVSGKSIRAISREVRCGDATVHRSLERSDTPRRAKSVTRLGDSRRRCCRCGVVKDLDQFNRSKRLTLGRGYHCRVCREEMNMIRWHGINRAQYNEMLLSQGGGCAICGSTDSRHPVSRLVIDHCHVTGKVRGLLCSHCNRGIGFLEDSSERLRQAANYLDSHRATSLARNDSKSG